MRNFMLAIFFLVLTMTAHAEGFKLTNLQRYGGAPGMELFLRGENGSTLQEIFSVVELSGDEFYVRLVGISTETTSAEMLKYYKENMPKELDAALQSSGHWHDPAVSPLGKSFPGAFKATSLHSSLAEQLAKHGYTVTQIHCEKYQILSNGFVSAPDVHVYCVKDSLKE
ncbi:MAG: hypothetical protein JEZ02_07625 [Desulfatibacillum sp.]|nr:hypothetical protein [Desulfatibacillum sp.]